MQMLHDRRSFLASLSSASAAGVLAGLSLEKLGLAPGHSFAQDGPPETTTIRLPERSLGICGAPQYIVDELLHAEGFTDIQRVATTSISNFLSRISRGDLDLSMGYAPGIVQWIDSGAPVTVVAGVHGGCNAMLAHEGIRSIRDLKGKKVGSNPAGLMASILAYVGLDPAKDVEWVPNSVGVNKELFIEHKIDACVFVPPDLQDLRARKIGHVIVDSARDRPWSQLFCCVLMGNREFVRTHPVATKRALRAILTATDFCASDPAVVARRMVDTGFTKERDYDHAVQGLTETAYNRWREFDPEDSIRFYALRLREASMIKSVPGKIIAAGTDWRFLNEIKRELKA
jgi:NitT/TauT family transport system substrate-binding protein